MKLQYIEYQEELQSLYNQTKDFGSGSCLEVDGLPGAGLGCFVDSYIRKYKSQLQAQKNIYCCVISCPGNDPRELFEFIIRKIAKQLSSRLKNQSLTEQQQKTLHEIEEESSLITEMSCRERIAYGIFSETVLEVMEKCGSFCSMINIRLFIKDFDNARKLLAKDVNYAMLFKNVCEEFTDWLGVIVTSHRTLAVIALMIESFSEFASLFKPITIAGFNEQQMQHVYHQMESGLQISLDDEARKKVRYFCGNIPQRLNLLFMAFASLKPDTASGMESDQWNHKPAAELIEKAYRQCRRQMDEHMIRIVRMVKDIKRNGLSVLQEALNFPLSSVYHEAREILFQMQVLKIEDYADKKITVSAIPVLQEILRDAIIMEETKGSGSMRFLHLSDLHFGCEKGETEEELRKNYIRDFLKKIEQIRDEKKIDYIFITGDIGWKAAEDDYAGAEAFLRNLLEKCALEADRLFLCPGNHDVNREISGDWRYPENQKSADSFFELDKLERHTQAFQGYCSLCKRIGCQPYQIKEYAGYLTGICYCKDITVICLNTAWLEKNKKVWPGKNYIITIKNMLDEHYGMVKTDERPLAVTLMHHPEKYWEEQECLGYSRTTNAWQAVTCMSDMILCGHTHEISDLENEVNAARIFRGGAFYENTTELNSFSIYDWKEEKYCKMRYIYMSGKWLRDD